MPTANLRNFGNANTKIPKIIAIIPDNVKNIPAILKIRQASFYSFLCYKAYFRVNPYVLKDFVFD